MKRFKKFVALAPGPSPPARGRGLKHKLDNMIEQEAIVAPRAGAWIETLDR